MKLLFSFFYDCGILLYRFGIFIVSFRNQKAKSWISGRRKIFHQIKAALQTNEQRVWFHCASAGEFEQGRPVIEAYRRQFPSHKIVLTFFSPSGFELRKNYSGADYIFYLPLDTKSNAGLFISLIDPRLAVFIKYEFWFHLLSELKTRKITCVLVSGVFRRNQFLLSFFAQPLKEVVKCFEKIFVQDEDSFRLLQEHGFSNAELAGDTRFDRVWEIAQSPKQLPIIQQFKAGKKLLVAGSTWKEDEDMLGTLIAIEEWKNNWKVIIVPHEVSESNIARLSDRHAVEAILLSEAEKYNGSTRVMIVDRMGLLSSIYQYADIAYIGGGFGKGIHNTLEAAAYGIPVLFGPHFQKFNEAKKLIESGGGKSVVNLKELKEAFQFYQSPEGVSMGKVNREWIKKETGATRKIISFLQGFNANTSASRG